MSSGVKKTNAMRMLDSAKIPYEVRTYEFEETDLAGVHAADAVGMPYETVFKTLVARGDKTGFVVFCIPVAEELDLKKAARASKNKSVERFSAMTCGASRATRMYSPYSSSRPFSLERPSAKRSMMRALGSETEYTAWPMP